MQSVSQTMSVLPSSCVHKEICLSGELYLCPYKIYVYVYHVYVTRMYIWKQTVAFYKAFTMSEYLCVEKKGLNMHFYSCRRMEVCPL